jgi:hypothetical protein
VLGVAMAFGREFDWSVRDARRFTPNSTCVLAEIPRISEAK